MPKWDPKSNKTAPTWYPFLKAGPPKTCSWKRIDFFYVFRSAFGSLLGSFCLQLAPFCFIVGIRVFSSDLWIEPCKTWPPRAGKINAANLPRSAKIYQHLPISARNCQKQKARIRHSAKFRDRLWPASYELAVFFIYTHVYVHFFIVASILENGKACLWRAIYIYIYIYMYIYVHTNLYFFDIFEQLEQN